nr:IS66 family transposase zinc-finger binding domain-containing protein [Sorangium cellulosum]
MRRKLEQLAADGQVPALIELVLGLLVQLRDKNTALSARLASALRELYGRKSQKVSTEQLMPLFAELSAQTTQGAADSAPSSEPGAEAPAQPEQGLVPQPPEPPKLPRRRGRAPLPAHLPRETRVVPVPEAERKCPQCGADKKCIGHRTSEVLEFVPVQFRVIEEQREKLACPRCPEQGVTTADSEKVMDRGRPGPGLLASIIVEKFDDAMPLYRQAQQYARFGVSLSRSTLGEWSAFALDVLASVAGKGAERLAVGYTVFGSCRMHGVNPLAWATDVIGKLQAGWSRERLDELLPDAWARASLAAPAAGDADAP